MLKTVKVVCELLKLFVVSYRTFLKYILQFHSFDERIGKMSLYVIGTEIKNRIPEEVKINKT